MFFFLHIIAASLDFEIMFRFAVTMTGLISLLFPNLIAQISENSSHTPLEKRTSILYSMIISIILVGGWGWAYAGRTFVKWIVPLVCTPLAIGCTILISDEVTNRFLGLSNE